MCLSGSTPALGKKTNQLSAGRGSKQNIHSFGRRNLFSMHRVQERKEHNS